MEIVIAFLDILAALLIPLGISGVFIALVIDLFLKRITWWNGVWTVRANVVLNILASGLGYYLHSIGQDSLLIRIFDLAPAYLAIFALVIFGPGGTWLNHKYFQKIGVSPSSSQDTSIIGVSVG